VVFNFVNSVTKLFKNAESQSAVMLRALCECLHIRGAKNSAVFENSHTLKRPKNDMH
jgi:hypothetical protein